MLRARVYVVLILLLFALIHASSATPTKAAPPVWRAP